MFKDKREEVEYVDEVQWCGDIHFYERVKECYTELKTAAEEDYQYLSLKLAQEPCVVVMQEDRYVDLLKLAYINEEVDKGLEALHNKFQFILLKDVINIGIVRSY